MGQNQQKQLPMRSSQCHLISIAVTNNKRMDILHFLRIKEILHRSCAALGRFYDVLSNENTTCIADPDIEPTMWEQCLDVVCERKRYVRLMMHTSVFQLLATKAAQEQASHILLDRETVEKR